MELRPTDELPPPVTAKFKSLTMTEPLSKT
ncbi:protein of unknown function [Hyphomicrobium sp. 1Nfss2.1]